MERRGALGEGSSLPLSAPVLSSAPKMAGERKSRSVGVFHWRPGVCCITGLTPGLAKQSRQSLQPALSREPRGKGLFIYSLLHMTSPLPYCLIDFQRDYTSAEETTTWKGSYQPLRSNLHGNAWKCCLLESGLASA